MFRYSFVPLAVFIVAVTITTMAVTQNISNPDTEDNPITQDAKMYASEYGIDLDTAIHRLMLQDLAGDLDAELSTKEADTFSGLWIQHTPQFQIVAQFTQNGDETIRPYIKNEALAEIVDVRIAKFTLAKLKADQAMAMLQVRNFDIPIESGINVFENRVELYVIERSRFETAMQRTKTELPNSIEIITVSELSVNTDDIFGGLALSECTSGFSVIHTSGEKGILTAAHCANELSYNGTDLDFKGSAEGGSYDVQWHTAPEFTVRNLAYDGSGNRYIYSTKHRDNQAVNEWVCKYGKITGYECGNIIDKNYQSTVPGHTWSPTFIRVHHDGVDLSDQGDSGGPWFRGNTAYGIMKSEIGDDAVYMAINYIDILDLKVITNRVYLPLILKDVQSQIMSGSENTIPYPPPIDESAPIEFPSESQPNPYP